MTQTNIIVYTNGPNAYAPRRVLEEAHKKGIDAQVVKYDGQKFVLQNGYEAKLPDAKGVFVRGMGEDVGHLPMKYFIINYYKGRAKVINQESFAKWMALDKTTQHVEYVKAGIPVAKSWFFGSGEEVLKWGIKQKFPLIAKFNAGSKGMSVYKIESYKDLEKLIESDQDIRTMLFQEFLEGAEDIRVIYLDGKILGAMKRIAKKGHYLTNYSQGGSVVKYDIDKDVKAQEIVKKVVDTFKLDYCGVDLMKNNKGEWIVLEVNRACQFEGFEKSTGINVASKIVDYLVK